MSFGEAGSDAEPRVDSPPKSRNLYQDSDIRPRHTSVLRFWDDPLEEWRAVERRLYGMCRGFGRGSERRTGQPHFRQRHPADLRAVVSVVPPARSDGPVFAVDVRRCASVAAIDPEQSRDTLYAAVASRSHGG